LDVESVALFNFGTTGRISMFSWVFFIYIYKTFRSATFSTRTFRMDVMRAAIKRRTSFNDLKSGAIP
jgi:hypothetical protein